MTQTRTQLVRLDASTFQKPLGMLAEVLAQKVQREAPKVISAPEFVAFDLFVLTRKAMRTYDLLFYLNADDRRKGDCYWKPVYSIEALALVRGMIDCLYNITAILQDPAGNGACFRKSGFKKALTAFNEEEKRYGGHPEWDEWIARGRDMLDTCMRSTQFTVTEVVQSSPWPTLGAYVFNKQTGGVTTPHQDFLKTFTYGSWREYSAMAHGAFEGLMPTAMYYIPDSVRHDDRLKIDETFDRFFSMHIGRAAGILLCIVTELQAYFHFDDSGARINERIHEMWNALMPVFEVKELYDQHYQQLMASRGM